MKLLIFLFLFSSFALAGENPTRDHIRLKLWYEGVSLQAPQSHQKASQRPLIEEIERPLQKLFLED